jgi:hypothetical protein
MLSKLPTCSTLRPPITKNWNELVSVASYRRFSVCRNPPVPAPSGSEGGASPVSSRIPFARQASLRLRARLLPIFRAPKASLVQTGPLLALRPVTTLPPFSLTSVPSVAHATNGNSSLKTTKNSSNLCPGHRKPNTHFTQLLRLDAWPTFVDDRQAVGVHP